MVLVFFLLVVAVGMPGVLFFASRIAAEPPIETKVAHSVEQLKAIAAQEPMRMDATPDWIRQALTRLSDEKESVETAESIARDVERQLATKSSGCIFAKTEGGAVNKEITPAWTATKNALDALLSGTKERIKHLTDENTAWGWVGWRGSREEQISELWVLAHAIETTTAEADLAFLPAQRQYHRSQQDELHLLVPLGRSGGWSRSDRLTALPSSFAAKPIKRCTLEMGRQRLADN
jgi:hypothetical protein